MSLNLMNGAFETEEIQIALGILGHYSDVFYSEIVGFFAADEPDYQVL